MATSVRDVAQLAGVSIGTVSNVLNSPTKVAQSTLDRVHSAIQELGFVRNDAARQLRAGRSLCLGMLVLDIRNPFFADVAHAAESAAATQGLSLLLGDSGASEERERTLLEMFETQRVRGVLVTPTKEDIPLLDRMRAHGIPAVMVDRLSSRPEISSVSVDDVTGGRLAVQHLAAIGRRDVLFVGGPDRLAQVRDRLSGAEQAAVAAGVRLTTQSVEALTVAEGVRVGRMLRADRGAIDAVFAANDLLALGVMQGFGVSDGPRVPNQLAIVGYDDIDFAAAAAIPLTSVHQPRAEMGRRAVDLLMAEVDGGAERTQIVLDPRLVVRDSTSLAA